MHKDLKKNNITDVIELLKRRGFLIDCFYGKKYLSNLTLIEEKEFLKNILDKYKLGVIKENEIILYNNCSNVLFNELFEKKYGTYGIESFHIFETLDSIIMDEDYDRINIDYVEPYVARYVEAINLIGIHTYHSCDGNHKDKYQIEIGIKPMYIPIHIIIWEELLSKMFDVNWENDYQEIKLGDNKYQIYETLYQASNYLIDNRKKLKELVELSIIQTINVQNRNQFIDNGDYLYNCFKDKFKNQF